MAPVSYQSGKVSVVYLRHQCNRFLRATVHLWVDLSRHYCDWARIYYEAHRKKGQSHACALRCLGMRWLKIIAAMMRNQTPYDARAPYAQPASTRILGVAVATRPNHQEGCQLNAQIKQRSGGSCCQGVPRYRCGLP